MEKRNTGANAKAKFIKVICKHCGAENVLFSRATIRIKCPDCGIIQTVPKGGKCGLINCRVEDYLR